MNRPVLLAAALALVTGGLVFFLWPRADAGPALARQSTERYAVELTTSGLRQGGNTFALAVTDRAGAPADLAEVTVEPVMPQMGHALTPTRAHRESPGRYRAADTLLPMSGPWQLTVVLHGPKGVDRVVFPLLVK
ncbi:uncharacterized protein YjeT (DUF2065 family) [Crossiella equi]|uniref:Uncharacterized protein YjeT (DUF2065 family) n=1 Tax=Crossiella equi TaxID=130796 RepID=A0ABS5AA94_9PSEU|nr:FixH family protein [Crossiella equi]MBP2473226.1 uncharacterized protein YjeT (DUF2065 family) [Crossiella equi]